MASLVIRNGLVTTAVDSFKADIFVEDGTVRWIGRDLQVGEGVPSYDAGGLLVLPGGVDVHTHLDWDFGHAHTCDTFETGTKAAAFGGTTCLVDFCNQGDSSPLAALEDWHERASTSCIDVAAHLILKEVTDQVLIDMRNLIHREGVSSFKLFTAFPGVFMVDDAALFRAMRVARDNDALTCIHAENGPVIEVLIQEALAAGHTGPKYHEATRPSIMEGEAVQRVITLSELAQAPIYLVHVSAAEALSAVVAARDRGIPVYAETCPHYLFLTKDEYERRSQSAILAPG